jgi:ornithine decarboxylase
VKYRNRSSLLIRVSFSSPEARCDLSRKFGCEPEAVADLLRLAADSRIKIDGLSFHVGSQAAGPAMFVEAIARCGELLRLAAQMGHAAGTLDIGGGFPVDYLQRCMPIEEFAAPIRAALALLPPAARVIAEPGRYICAPAAISVASVMGRAQRDGRWWYYLDDGLYGSYSGQVYDHAAYPVDALVPAGRTYPSVLAGPTCDSIDVIRENLELPKLEVGDLVVGRSMGAYTWASASEFNFFPRATVLALDGGRLLADRGRR